MPIYKLTLKAGQNLPQVIGGEFIQYVDGPAPIRIRKNGGSWDEYWIGTGTGREPFTAFEVENPTAQEVTVYLWVDSVEFIDRRRNQIEAPTEFDPVADVAGVYEAGALLEGSRQGGPNAIYESAAAVAATGQPQQPVYNGGAPTSYPSSSLLPFSVPTLTYLSTGPAYAPALRRLHSDFRGRDASILHRFATVARTGAGITGAGGAQEDLAEVENVLAQLVDDYAPDAATGL